MSNDTENNEPNRAGELAAGSRLGASTCSAYWMLFDHMMENHSLPLTDGELADIARQVEDMRTQSDSEALNEAKILIDEIMKGEVNPEDEAEKWLRAFAPEYLRPNGKCSCRFIG